MQLIPNSIAHLPPIYAAHCTDEQGRQSVLIMAGVYEALRPWLSFNEVNDLVRSMAPHRLDVFIAWLRQ